LRSLMNDSIMLPLVDALSFPHRAPVIQTTSPLFTGAHVTIFYNSRGVLFFNRAGMVRDFQKYSIA